jgi:hypothetical protein
MKINEKLPELIDRYTQGDLTGGELNEFTALANRSVRLREEIRLNRELDEVLGRVDILDLRKKIIAEKNRKKRPDSLPFLWAAIALVLIGMEVLLLLSVPDRKTGHDSPSRLADKPRMKKQEMNNLKDPVTMNPSAAETKPVIRLQTPTDRAFQANPAFEKLIGATRQSSGFRLNSPESGTFFIRNNPVAFRWLADETSEIRLQIIDNQGRIVVESGTLKESAFSVPANQLANGIYYFRIYQDEDIMYFGKFFIK